jgi:hypothetical protein
MDPYEFVWALHQPMFYRKSKPREELGYSFYPRFTPTSNVRITQAQVENFLSVILIFVAMIQVRKGRDPKNLRFQRKFYANFGVKFFLPSGSNIKESLSLSDPKLWRHGVCGWGPLASQHGLCKLALADQLTYDFLLCAKIAPTTKAWISTRDTYGYKDGTAQEFIFYSDTIIEALAFSLQISKLQAEELFCRTSQFRRHTTGQRRDWLPPCTL